MLDSNVFTNIMQRDDKLIKTPRQQQPLQESLIKRDQFK